MNSFQASENLSRAKTFPLNCSRGNLSKTCPANDLPSRQALKIQGPQPPTCPDYFRWIHEDLRPWMKSGITKEMVMAPRKAANFRPVIVKGKAYVETYRKSFQTRDTFTLWGILQLLRRYPGRVPDLDLMFHCGDMPVVLRENFRPGARRQPPPVFRYCGHEEAFDIVFPDWSFWGWAEINIKPWGSLAGELKEGNRRMKWEERQPYAYWKGNPQVSQTRLDLLDCNITSAPNFDYKARIYNQDWLKEQEEGYKNSNLADQCIHRYKIYVEGRSWSVSHKYILACDSTTLLVRPSFHDFFSRSLLPLKHYWPITDDAAEICASIRRAVDWGNANPAAAQAIGEEGSRFVAEQVKMEYVYDYMLQLLKEYAKLLRYRPSVPEKAVEICSETMACAAEGRAKRFMDESLVERPAVAAPCVMPPPFDAASFGAVWRRKEEGMEGMKSWEREYEYRRDHNQF
ncbi:uncharacterized protein LOC127245925 [Andrographis paniculata]|uniref:uncharacterized protein LOC127245925 n=1 Tax=Andrographis paniculata TaxID=175694 RepID=UPI0021E89D55|nr:uncharacterized protein LOC127245925 [Andrographis paniculata]